MESQEIAVERCVWEYITSSLVVADCDQLIRPWSVTDVRRMDFCPYCRRRVEIEDVDDGK